MPRKKIILFGFCIIIIVLLIFLITTFFKSKKYISLPLNIETTINDISSPSSLFNNNIRTTIKISSNEQEVDLFLLSKSFSFFITQEDEFFENNEQSSINPYAENFYDDKISSSLKIINNKTKVTYERYLYGKVAQENFFLCTKDNCNSNSIQLKNFKFILTENPMDKISGSIGLNLNEDLREGGINFVNELYRQKYIDYPVWYINYENSNFNIGKFPHEVNKKYKNKNLFFDEVSSSDSNLVSWELQMENLYIGNENLKDIKKMIFELKPELGLIYGSPKFYKKLKDKFFGHYINETYCHENIFKDGYVGYYFIYCDESVDISKFPTLKFDNYYKFNFELSYKEMFKKVENKNLFLFFTDENENYFNDKWKIGEPFLRKYMTVFDQKNKYVGFYLDMERKSYGFLNGIGFVLLIIGSIVAMFLCFVAYRKCRLRRIKKAAFEMDVSDKVSGFVSDFRKK